MNSQAPTLAALERALSRERIQAYAIPQDADFHDAVARYFWNVALASALQPALHALEVTLRNQLFDASSAIVDATTLRHRDVACWLDADPTLLERAEFEAVQEAKAGLLHHGHRTPGRLVAKLSLGFWVSLCKRPYEQGRTSGPRLWPALAKTAFPYAPVSSRNREAIYRRLNELRIMRNRISHHEPVWDRDVIGAHSNVLETIGWMNAAVAHIVEEMSLLKAVHTAGWEAFRPDAIRSVKIPAPE